MARQDGLAKLNVLEGKSATEEMQVNSHASEVAENLYTYQQKTMPILLAWGLGSVVAGFIWRRDRSKLLYGMGSQFIAWGAVDASIAALAIANAVKKSGQVESGEIPPREHYRQAEQFRRIVWLNALLDIGYMLFGIRFTRRNAGDRQRRGTGWGIIVQGAFLFVWDILLALFVPRLNREN